MAVSAADYARQLRALLPRGPLWQFEVSSTFLRVLEGLAETFARLHLRAEDLLKEADPRSTTELLTEWEETVGLPDGCVPEGGSTEQRRAAVVARLTATGGASAAYFEAVAARYGYSVTVENVGLHAWRISTAEMTGIVHAKAGLSRAGDPIRSFGNEQLECLFSRIKPAHTVLTFAYGVTP